MMAGEKINRTEGRAALHTALRNLGEGRLYQDGHDIMPDIRRVRRQMRETAGGIRAGRIRGYTGKRLKHIVNIGIGGSDLGPRLAVEALKPFRRRDLTFHFMSNVDGAMAAEVLQEINPEKSLFIVASKTFTTQETMTNAETARRWLLEFYGDSRAVAGHFMAVTANREAAEDFGVSPGNVFEFWDWVGGRFSLTSAIGLPVMIAVGYRHFLSLLRGFRDMDLHVRSTPLEKNIPVIMALLGVWYNNFFGAASHAVVPYAHQLRMLPAYLQQAEMESNGKSVDRNGKAVTYSTAPVIWGGDGTNGQHAFFQLLHQGHRLIPIDFIGFCRPHHNLDGHHRKLLANFLAQSQALAFGKNADSLRRDGTPESLIPHKVCPGNRPSNTLLAEALTPYVLGKLISIYEHKVFVQGVIWNIFSFDQWGVELGKRLAGDIYDELESARSGPDSRDGSTDALIAAIRRKTGR
jgi:glucose-6-phosphate isomerase